MSDWFQRFSQCRDRSGSTRVDRYRQNRMRSRKVLAAPSLFDLFDRNEGRLMDKWLHYFPIYERHFAPYRGNSPTFLEIGVSHGGSLDMWRQWLGRGTHVIGIDIDPRCTTLAGRGIDIRIGDQAAPDFLDEIIAEFGPFDIVLDDGGHFPHAQIASLDRLWSAVKPGGVYVVEDTHTNYWPGYDGGLLRPDTFIEHVKPLVDDLHGFHSQLPEHQPSEWTHTLGAAHFYDSVVVLDREDRTPPSSRKTGRPSFDTLYGQQPHELLTEEHLAEIEAMQQPSRRFRRAMRSPIAALRSLPVRLRRAVEIRRN